MYYSTVSQYEAVSGRAFHILRDANGTASEEKAGNYDMLSWLHRRQADSISFPNACSLFCLLCIGGFTIRHREAIALGALKGLMDLCSLSK